MSCAIWRGRWWHWKSQKKNSTDGTWYLRSFFQCVLPITEGTDPPKGEFHYRPCSTQLPISTTRFGTPLLKENILSGKFKWRTGWNLFLKESISSNITTRGAVISELKKVDGTSYFRSQLLGTMFTWGHHSWTLFPPHPKNLNSIT